MRTMRQQYDKINQSIFNSSLRSVLLFGISPQINRRIPRAFRRPMFNLIVTMFRCLVFVQVHFSFVLQREVIVGHENGSLRH